MVCEAVSGALLASCFACLDCLFCHESGPSYKTLELSLGLLVANRERDDCGALLMRRRSVFSHVGGQL